MKCRNEAKAWKENDKNRKVIGKANQIAHNPEIPQKNWTKISADEKKKQ